MTRPVQVPRGSRIGEIAYLRVRIVDRVNLPFGLHSMDAVAVQLVDRAGKPIGEVTHYVPETALVSKADAITSVTEGLR
jgi:hypothetical protein